ncbi:MAG: hypothetical protein JWN30_142, partial [Bacilli bacterium]|nr:hypothetical protein [Bacilli bacterium]
MIRLLFLGDVVGEPGIRCLQIGLQEISQAYQPDLILANGENSAPEGKGLSVSAAERLWDAGVEIITLGNHAWDHRDVINRLHQDLRIVRPANYPGNAPGHGFTFVTVKGIELLIINMLGRAFMTPVDCPFQKLDQILAEQGSRSRHILLDFHAETTSEKLAMAWDFDGRISAILG